LVTVTIKEAQAKLPELIDHLAAGEELVITRDQQPIARLLVTEKPKRKPRQAGNCQGLLVIVADDEHLQDLKFQVPSSKFNPRPAPRLR
jgi:antitoxin (DNA-binding transcriptional repressor) of toxin-antitoxin stability system